MTPRQEAIEKAIIYMSNPDNAGVMVHPLNQLYDSALEKAAKKDIELIRRAFLTGMNYGDAEREWSESGMERCWESWAKSEGLLGG
jgi:hypothetical protein